MKSNHKGHVQNAGTSSWKKIVLPILVLFISAASFAQSQPCNSPVERKQIIIPEVFHEIEVRGDVTVILTADESSEVLVEGAAVDLGTVRAMVKKGKLLIEGSDRRCSSKVTVFVSVANVSSLTINRGAEIYSFGKIRVVNLK